MLDVNHVLLHQWVNVLLKGAEAGDDDICDVTQITTTAQAEHKMRLIKSICRRGIPTFRHARQRSSKGTVLQEAFESIELSDSNINMDEKDSGIRVPSMWTVR